VGTPLAADFLDTPRRPLGAALRRILFLGRLAAEKGLERLLDAAAKLPEHRFCIGGDGPLRHQVQSAADRLPNLKYVGWLSRAQVLSALDASDILVLPSSLETFGTVALEALARHRLVLVSRGCGIAQWPSLAEGLFAIERDEDLADALLRIARMAPARRQAIAAAGWKAAEEFQEQTLSGWVRVVAEVAQATPGRSSP
jgi:glycosyltransferase involved in cell wall biosynthesis